MLIDPDLQIDTISAAELLSKRVNRLSWCVGCQGGCPEPFTQRSRHRSPINY